MPMTLFCGYSNNTEFQALSCMGVEVANRLQEGEKKLLIESNKII
jgi:hypothetical protein